MKKPKISEFDVATPVTGDYIPFVQVQSDGTFLNKKYDISQSVVFGLIGKLIGFNLNSTADQLITLVGGTKFAITDVLITNVSKVLTTVASTQINEGANKTGVQVWLLTGPTIRNLNTPSAMYSNSVGGGSTVINTYPTDPGHTVGNTLYASNLVAEGSAATADIYVFGYKLA